jgi:hypothetical protein
MVMMATRNEINIPLRATTPSPGVTLACTGPPFAVVIAKPPLPAQPHRRLAYSPWPPSTLRTLDAREN